MTKRFIALSAMLIIGAGTFLLVPTKFKPDFAVGKAETFCRVCESVLMERLTSPASYNRVSCSEPKISPATEEQYLGWNWPGKKEADFLAAANDNAVKKSQELVRRLFDQGRDGFVISILKYDAANAFGTSLREPAVCEAIIYDLFDYSDTSTTSIRINGDTSLEWILRGVQ